MGRKMASIYDTLILAFLEENLCDITDKKYNGNIEREFTKSWKKYLDDCFMFGNCTWGNINDLHKIL